MPFEVRSDVRHGCALSHTLFNKIIDCILSQGLQDYPGVQFGANVHASDLAFGDYNVIISSRYNYTQGLLKAVDRHAAIIDMCINASKAKVMSALIPGEQRQAVLLDGEPVEDIEKFKYLGSMFVAKGHRIGDQEQD